MSRNRRVHMPATQATEDICGRWLGLSCPVPSLSTMAAFLLFVCWLVQTLVAKTEFPGDLARARAPRLAEASPLCLGSQPKARGVPHMQPSIARMYTHSVYLHRRQCAGLGTGCGSLWLRVARMEESFPVSFCTEPQRQNCSLSQPTHGLGWLGGC